MTKFHTSHRFDIAFLAVMAISVSVAIIFRVAIGDYVYYLHYQPSTKTLQVGNDAGLSSLGLHYLERTNPEFIDASTIVTSCGPNRLGCLSGHSQAYILDGPLNQAQTVVTNTHERLHLAYQRLSNSKKTELAHLIDQAIDENASAGITTELASQTDTADRRDEAHSLLGSEYRLLPRELENYFSEYFSDRSKELKEYALSIR